LAVTLNFKTFEDGKRAKYASHNQRNYNCVDYAPVWVPAYRGGYVLKDF
jgi:hypothetical protein